MEAATFKALLKAHGRHARAAHVSVKQMRPVGIAADYRGAIVKGPLGYARALIDRYVVPALPALAAKPNRIKLDAGEKESIGHALDDARKAWARKYPREKLAGIVAPVGLDLAKFQAFQLNRQLREAVSVDVVGSEPWLPPVIEAFTQENVSLIKTIPSQFFDDLEKHLSSEIGDGVRFEELTDTIAERYGVAENRAELIARDQAGKFFGDLNRVRQVDLGIEGAIWRGMLDNRERDEHIDREGQEFDWDTGIDGETPGQPVLCFPGWTSIRVNAPIRKAFRRRYTGKLATLITDEGVSLNATPNHPMLTQRGWLPAQSVNVGDYLVEISDQSAQVFEQDVQNGDTNAREVFEALSVLCGEHTIRSATPGFHGDATPNEQIDVVDIDRSLSLDGPALSFEGARKFLFTEADHSAFPQSNLAECLSTSFFAGVRGVRGLCKLLALCVGQTSMTQEHGRAALAWGKTLTDDLASNGCAADAKLFSDLFDTDPSVVTNAHEIARVLFRVARRGVASLNLDATTSQFDAEQIGRDVQNASGLAEAHPRYKFRRVVEKRLSELSFSGHVYNLETRVAYYIAQGFVVHNCRCNGEPNLRAVLEG